MQTKKIGEINVDSGCIMITDPLYLHNWKHTSFVDKREYRDTKSGKVYVYGKDFKKYNETLFDEKDVNQLVAEKRLERICEEDKEYSYKGVSTTLTQQNSVECENNLAIAARTYSGDGTYPVYAEIEEESERITKIWIDFV